MLKSKKKFMIPVIAMLLLVAMAGSALAYTGYSKHTWSGQLSVNKVHSYDKNETRLIQQMLRDHNGFLTIGIGLDVDGAFASDTKWFVERYQRDYNLQEDGIVGSGTWSSLQSKLYDDGKEYLSNASNRYYHRYSYGYAYLYRHYEDGKWYVEPYHNGLFYHVN